MFRIKLLPLAILSAWFLFAAEAKPLDIKTSDSIYLSLNLKDPSKIGLEFSFINKIDLKGEYGYGDKSLKMKASLKELDLDQINEHIKLPLAGYIQNGDFDIEIEEFISLKGELEADELKFAARNTNLKGNIKLLGYLKLLGRELDYHINYQIKDGYSSKLKDIKKIQAKGFLKENKLFLNKAELIYRNIPLEATGQVEDFSSPRIKLKLSGKPGVLAIKTRYDKKLDKMKITGLAEIWGGEINLKGMLSLPENRGSFNITAEGIDVGQAAHELDAKGKKPKGKLSFEANLTNVDLFTWKNLLGEGKILISDGDIYQINFLKGFGKFLSIPGFENIVFRRAYSDIFFQGRDIFFENFQLNAAEMNIEGKGKITTSGIIDFLLFPQFSQGLMESSKSLQKYLAGLLGDGIFSVSISGTVKDPIYTTNIAIAPALDKLDDIKDILGDFLKF